MRVFEIDLKWCRGCLNCLGACPAEAISLAGKEVVIDSARCIGCGNCLVHCGHSAIRQKSEVDKVKEFITSHRRVILAFDPACVAFLPEGVSMEQLAAAVQELGVWDSADASEGAAAVAAEYAKLMEDGRMDTLVTSACPVVLNMMEQYYPKTLKYLAPVASPMIVQGRMLKRDFTSAAVVYVSTCAARLEEAKDVRHSTEINAVLTVGELLNWLREENINPAEFQEEPLLTDGGGIGVLSAVAGGMRECVSYFAPNLGKRTFCVDGIESCKQLLEELQAGKLPGCFIEMSACPGGCVGSIVDVGRSRDVLGRFEAKLRLHSYVDAHDAAPYFDTHGIALANPTIDYSVGEFIPSEEQIQEMLYRIGVGNARQQKNCGQCGFPTCRERAVAVLKEKEPVSICRRVIHENRLDIYSVLYENLPMAALLIDDTQKIVGYNEEAGSIFMLRGDQEKYIFELMDPVDVQYVFSTGLAIRNKKVEIPDYYLTVEAYLVPLKKLGMVLVLLEDVTEEEEEENKQLQSKLESVEMAQKVIDKQMMVAQQIAFLLGETTAETKVTLNQLKRRILGEEDAE